MRTTFDLDDGLAVRAKKLAVERRTTLKALVESGLRRVLSDSDAAGPPARRLKGLGRRIWERVDADRYIREQRNGWS